MKTMSKRFFAMMFALVMCFTCIGATTAFAAEVPNAETVAETVDANSAVMPRSVINGYANKTLTHTDNKIRIQCASSGTGGMGITIQVGNSGVGGVMDISGRAISGSAESISGNMHCSGMTLKYGDLWHSELKTYEITFDVPAGASIPVQVWIYG